MNHQECHEDAFCGDCVREDKEALIEQRDKALRELDAIKLQVGALQDFIYRVIDQHGFNVHTDEKCPEDDTCECPLAVEANKLLTGYTEKRVVSNPKKNERHDCEHCICSCTDCGGCGSCPHGIKVGDGPCGLCG